MFGGSRGPDLVVACSSLGGRGEKVDAADFNGVPARKLAEQNRSNSGKAKDELSQSRAKPLEGEGVETRRAAPTAPKVMAKG